MKIFALVATSIASLAFQMSVDAGYLRNFAWLIPWAWGASAALWAAWMLTHEKVANQWLKRLHEKMGRGIQPIRAIICLIVFIVVALGVRAFVAVKKGTIAEVRPSSQAKPPEPSVEVKPTTVTPAAPQKERGPKSVKSTPPAPPHQDNSVRVDHGSTIQQQSSGDCSPNMVGGTNTVNCGPPALTLSVTWGPSPDPLSTCTGLTTNVVITPNQAVSPPLHLAFDVNTPVLVQPDISVKGAGVVMSGGSYRLGFHPKVSLASPGITPDSPAVIRVCTRTPIFQVSNPHLEGR